MRFTLASMAAPGTDIVLSEDRILSYRAFANKIWNAARFLFLNLDKFSTATGTTLEDLAAPEIREGAPCPAPAGTVPLADRWIFARLARVTEEMNDALEGFRFHEAAHVVYHFFWGDFCDWYIEWVKPELSSTDRERAAIRGRICSPRSRLPCDCCIPSCRSSPRNCGSGFRKGRVRDRSRLRRFLPRARNGRTIRPRPTSRSLKKSSPPPAIFARR